MRDSISLSNVPCDENGLRDNCSPNDKAYELSVYVRQLKRTFPEAIAAGCKFVVRSHPHDLGDYREVFVVFDYDDKLQRSVALWIEGNTPLFWDLLAISELSTLAPGGREYPFGDVDRSEGNQIPPFAEYMLANAE